MTIPFRLKGSGTSLRGAHNGFTSETTPLRYDSSASARRSTHSRRPHAAAAAPQHAAAAVRAPWLSASLDGEGQCRKIRLAARWQDVHSAVSNEVSLSPATAAFALHRLGCLFVYMSWQRRAELKASQLVEQLVDGAARHVRSFGGTDVALVLDGLARLRIQPPAVLLDALAEQARQHAKELSASQVPIILWAFAVLRYNPTVAVLSALDHRIEQHSSAMTAQGVSLVLSSYQQWRYHPEGGSLAALAASMRQRVAAFKNSELATCVEAFSALGFHPGNDLVQALAARAGAAVSPAWRAQAVVNHKALDAVSAEARRAAAQAASTQAEGKTAEDFGAAVSSSGQAAAASIRQKAKDATIKLRDAGQDLLAGPQGSGRMVQDWVYEFGQWSEGRSPSLCAAVAVQHDLPCSRWCFSSSSQTNYRASH